MNIVENKELFISQATALVSGEELIYQIFQLYTKNTYQIQTGLVSIYQMKKTTIQFQAHSKEKQLVLAYHLIKVYVDIAIQPKKLFMLKMYINSQDTQHVIVTLIVNQQFQLSKMIKLQHYQIQIQQNSIDSLKKKQKLSAK